MFQGNKYQLSGYRKFLVDWLTIYLLITGLIYLLNDLICIFPLYLQTLILTVISTLVMSFVVKPFFNRIFL